MQLADKPTIALVGRPNVGKSTLFNRLVGRRAAIVEDLPGVTRDRHYGDSDLLGRQFMVIDTGGFEPATDDGMLKAMRAQAEIAIAEADVVIALFDGREGMLPADEEITRMLQRSGKAVHYAVNKIDGVRHEPLAAEFWALGVPMIWPISAQHGPGVYDLLEAVLEDLPEAAPNDEPVGNITRVAIVGKPNAGKSTLVNKLLGEERLLTSDIPGTTRDSIDTWLEREPDAEAVAQLERALAALKEPEPEPEPEPLGEQEQFDWEDDRAPLYTWEPGEEPPWDAPGDDDDDDEAAELEAERERLRAQLDKARLPRRYLMIDTAGVRRRKWVKTALEKYSIVRSFKSIDRADVCLLLIDATQGVTDQDAKLAGLVQAKGKACVILVNKWDIVPDKDTWTAGSYVKQLRMDLGFVSYAPIVFISALTGQRVHRILATVDAVRRNWERRVRTGVLNRYVTRLTELHHPPTHKGKRPRLYYATQVAAAPPTILLSLNYRDALKESYKRFLLNRIRTRWDFEGTPLRLVLRGKSRKQSKKG